MSELSKEAFDNWKSSPTGREWFNLVREKRAALVELIAIGHTVDPNSFERTAMQTVNIVAEIRQLDEILKFEA